MRIFKNLNNSKPFPFPKYIILQLPQKSFIETKSLSSLEKKPQTPFSKTNPPKIIKIPLLLPRTANPKTILPKYPYISPKIPVDLQSNSKTQSPHNLITKYISPDPP